MHLYRTTIQRRDLHGVAEGTEPRKRVLRSRLWRRSNKASDFLLHCLSTNKVLFSELTESEDDELEARQRCVSDLYTDSDLFHSDSNTELFENEPEQREEEWQAELHALVREGEATVSFLDFFYLYLFLILLFHFSSMTTPPIVTQHWNGLWNTESVWPSHALSATSWNTSMAPNWCKIMDCRAKTNMPETRMQQPTVIIWSCQNLETLLFGILSFLFQNLHV